MINETRYEDNYSKNIREYGQFALDNSKITDKEKIELLTLLIGITIENNSSDIPYEHAFHGIIQTIEDFGIDAESTPIY